MIPETALLYTPVNFDPETTDSVPNDVPDLHITLAVESEYT